jgi:predicted N-formylglutamate amidohydrolase
MSLPLLTADDPAPAEVLAGRDLRLLVVCDHASNGVPLALDHLGLSDETLSHHVAYDRGARALAVGLSERLDAPAVLGGFSRLVIDLNRDPSSSNSIPAESDGIPIPGNQGLDPAHRAARRTELFDAYQGAVATALDRARTEGIAPAVVNVHSFTPALSDGVQRPWQIGLLWRHDDRLVRPLQEHLHAEPGLAVGDNEPYSGHIHEGYTLPHHAEQPGLAHVLLEVRDDQLVTDEGVEEWVVRLSGALDVARGRLVAER